MKPFTLPLCLRYCRCVREVSRRRALAALVKYHRSVGPAWLTSQWPAFWPDRATLFKDVRLGDQLIRTRRRAALLAPAWSSSRKFLAGRTTDGQDTALAGPRAVRSICQLWFCLVTRRQGIISHCNGDISPAVYRSDAPVRSPMCLRADAYRTPDRPKTRVLLSTRRVTVYTASVAV